MNIDFELVMVLALLVCAVLWGIDTLRLRPARMAARERLMAQMGSNVDEARLQAVTREPILVEYARSFLPVLLVVLLLRSFLVEPFRIPSGSMMPTLLVGDFIMVNKYAYGLRLPVLKTRLVDIDSPRRGDVAVFRFPKDPSIDYIKRVVGVPGDVIGYYDKRVHINGVPVAQTYLERYSGVGSGVTMSGAEVRLEDLGEVEHRLLIDPNKPTQFGEITVPEGYYFVLGDNRDNSNDSRFWGLVPEQNLVGRAFMIWMSWDDLSGCGIVTFWRCIAWDRIGTIIE